MNNIEKVKESIRMKNIDALLVTGAINRRYVTGFSSSAGIVLITKEDAFFYTDSRYIEAAEQAVQGAKVYMVDSKATYVDKINNVLTSIGAKKLGVEEEILSHAEYMKYKNKLSASLKPAQNILTALRTVKDEEEIKLLYLAQSLAEKAYDRVLQIIKPGMTEKEVAAELVYQILLLGADNVSFDPIVVSGAKTSMPHGVPGDDIIKKGSFLTMDFGCILNGYCSDMTRTVAIGKVTEEMKKVYQIVLQAQLRGIKAAKAGVTGAYVDAAARDLIAQEGYGEYFGHGFGHGLGMEVHESPTASPSGKTKMPENAVISAEPGIYLPGKFGVRIEDVIVLRKGGCDNLMSAPKELVVI
ncbi:MAG: aminopeptidase P family protein [Clostridiales bacterium]|nr:aminopeptidase P family protein [Clostridiales bacterium]